MNALDFDRAQLWRFRARPLSITDGDTLRVECDCGFYGRHEVAIRLAGFSAPETHEAGGDEATRRLMLAVESGVGEWPLRVATLQRETVVREVRSFERFVADVWVVQADGELVDVVELL